MPELLIYSDIGASRGFFDDDGVTAQAVKDQLDSMDGDVTIRINSMGGDVFEGHAIYNLIRHYQGGKKTVQIDGIAASAASVIAMAGDEIVMPINAMLMIHDPFTMAIGNAEEMTKTAEILEQIKGTIVDVYANKVDIDKGRIAEMMSEETWLNADEAEGFGFAVKDSNQKAILNKIPAKTWINHAPEIEVVEEPELPPAPNFEARKRYLEIVADAI